MSALNADEKFGRKSSNKLHGEGWVFDSSASSSIARLRKLASQSQNTLLKFKSIYPFDLFPDTVTIDTTKVNIIKKDIFGTEDVHSILIEHISNVSVSTGIISSTMEIIDSSNERFPITYSVKRLRKNDALLARRLIQGLIAAKHAGIDLSICDGEDVLACLNVLGYAQGENHSR